MAAETEPIANGNLYLAPCAERLGQVSVLATGSRPSSIAVDATTVYFTDAVDGTVVRVRLRLDAPIPVGAHRVTHVYYTHLSDLVTEQAESSATKKHVVAGERIATSGIGNGVAHLHLGLLLDDQVEQDSWTFILREDAIRKIMGGYRNGEPLPLRPPPS